VYDYLEGRLSERRATRVVLDVSGVGYDLAVPLGAEFAARDGVTRVWTHLVVREDAHLLFGFPDRKVREVFRLLLQVRGVGPTMALGVLSTLTGEELLLAISAQDTRPLVRVKGIGKKTAEQILLDLREKAPRLLGAPPGEAGTGVLVPTPPAGARALEDAVRALVSIGYSDKDARRSVDKAATKVSPEDLERLVRAALQE